jgi:PAS domain S-box-containing protein
VDRTLINDYIAATKCNRCDRIGAPMRTLKVLNTSSFLAPDSLLAAIIDSSEDAIISKDLRSVVTSWNKAAQRIFGYTADEMIGTPIDRLFPRERLDEEADIMSRIQKGERVEHFETVRVRKDGSRIDVSLTISPIRDSDGKIIGASKIARDITEQKLSLRKLTEAHEELKRADRMKAEFVATLSHELRTPLTAISGWVQVLQDNPSPDELEQAIQVIDRNVRMQGQLIEDLLDMSRIEAGKINLDLQRVDLATVATSAMETVNTAIESKEIRLTSSFGSINGVVLGDKNRLQQIIWNLLSNAVKFSPRQGKVHVVIRQVNSHVELSVIDNGKGISPEFLSQVFDRFRQADASTTRSHGGLGLGLAIAKHLAELHGGSLKAYSAGQDQGATLTLILPLLSAYHAVDREGISPQVADSQVDENDLSGVRVLVVEDEPDSADIVARILRRHRAEVRTAGSVASGLHEFERFEPHVVLTDIGMPEHDGFELLRRLRDLPGGRKLPVVALTALARSEDRTRALRAGFQMHVPKPIDAAELVAIVQNLAGLTS